MPGAPAPSICLDGFVLLPSGFALQLGDTTAEVPVHVRDAPLIDGVVQVHLPEDAPGSMRVRHVLEREEPTTAARLSVSLAVERSRTISRDEALSVANQLGVYLDLPERVDLVDPADDRFLPITSDRGVTSSASATGVRVIPEKHLLGDLATAADTRTLNNYAAMRGQLRLTSNNVEIGVPRAVVDALPSRAAEPQAKLAAPVVVNGYAEVMSHLDGLAQGQQAKVTAIAANSTHEVLATMHSWGLAVSGPLPRRPDSISVSLPVPARPVGRVEIDTERWRPVDEPFRFDDGRITAVPGGGEQVAVRYELIRADDEWLFVVRVHLTGDPDAVAQVQQLATEGVQTYLNDPRHVLPMVNLPMRVEVQFVDASRAHLTVAVTAPDTQMDQAHWAQDRPPAFYAHEVLHALGAIDHQPPSRRTGGDLPADPRTSLMSPRTPGSPVAVLDEDLQQIMDTLAPIYAGVAGDHGPLVRPDGAATAAQGPSSVSESWNEGLSRPPRMPDPAETPGPAGPSLAPGPDAIVDLLYVEAMLPVLQMRLEQAERQLSPDHPEVVQTDRAFQELKGLVDEARNNGELPDKPLSQALLTSSFEDVLRWEKDARDKVSTLADQASEGEGTQQARRWLENVLYRDFLIETSALGLKPEDPGNAQFLPIVRKAFDPAASAVTDEQMQKLTEYVTDLIKGDQPVTMEALTRRAEFDRLRQRLGSHPAAEIDVAVAGWRTSSPDQDLKQRDRKLEVREFARILVQREGTFDPTTANLDSLDRVIESAYRRYAKDNDGARPHGPMPVEGLKALFLHKLGRETLSWKNVQLVASQDSARERYRKDRPIRVETAKKLAAAPGLGAISTTVNARHTRMIQSGPEQADSPEERLAEQKALWALVRPSVPGASSPPVQPAELAGATELARLGGSQAVSPAAQAARPPTVAVAPVTRDDLSKLVLVRRRLYADPRDRQYTGPSDYQQMALELLGAEGAVGAAELRDLAIMMRRLPRPRTLTMDRFDDRAARQWLTEQAISNWRPGPPGHRPDPQNPQEAPDARTDRSRMVTAFHAIDEMPFVADLTAWINRAVPFGAGQITEEIVQRKIASLFGQVLDDGAALEVTVGENTYDIRLWAVPTRGPAVEADSLPGAERSNRFSGKQENRIYGYHDLASWRTWATAASADGGLVYRAALGQAEALSGARIDLMTTLGRVSGKGQRELSANAPAEFQQLRIKEPLGWVNLPVNWALRVEARGTGKWRELTFRNGDGALREDKVRYAVAEFQLPYSAKESGAPQLKEFTDPDYLKPVDIRTPEQFPVWKLDHGVSRLQLSGAVLSEVQKALTPEDYAFWKPYVEGHLSNDQLALNLGDILRPRADRNYQQVFRLNLDAKGRQLSLSLTAGDRAQPVNSVTKVSEVSQSGETRFDRVQAVVAKTLLSEDAILTRRTTLTMAFRAVERYLRLGFRGQLSWQKGDQLIRHHRALLTRAERVVGKLQVALADFTVRLDVHHEREGRQLANGRHERVVTDPGPIDIRGFAHFMVHKDALAGLASAGPVGAPGRAGEASGTAASSTATQPATAQTAPKWWTPGADWGPTMDYVKNLGGVAELYNQIATRMATEGYLPKAAAGVGSTTPWDALQGLPVTGADVNKPGVEYANWQLLLSKLSERSLRAGVDNVLNIDPAQPGVAWVFSHPKHPVSPAHVLTIGLSAETTGGTTFVAESDKQVQYGHTSIDTMTAKRAKGKVKELSGYGGVGGNEASSFWQGQVGAQRSWTNKKKAGDTQSTALTSDTDGQKMSSPIFEVDIRWTWVALRNETPVGPPGTVDATATILQPNALNDVASSTTAPPLQFVPPADRSPAQIRIDSDPPEHFGTNPQLRSVLTEIGASVYTTLGVRGVGQLQEKLIQNVRGLPAVAVWNGLNRAAYRSNLIRALAAAATLPVGNQLVGLSVRPVGRPEIVKVWFPYTQQLLESQVGREEGAEELGEKGFLGGAYLGKESASAAGNELALGGGTVTTSTGQGTGSVAVQTVGSYRGLYQDQKMAVVRTVVVNRAEVGDVVVQTFGEVMLNVLLSDVIANRNAFDGAALLDEHLVDSSPDTPPKPSPALALITDLRPPVSLQHGLSWAVMWPMLYGTASPEATTSNQPTGFGKLSESLAAAAEEFQAPGLVAQLRALPSWLSPYMAKMRDGGALWRFKADGRMFEVSMSAELVGPAWGSRPGGNGIKVYERGNAYRDASRRFTTMLAVGGGATGTGRPDSLDGGFASGSLVGGRTRGEEQSDTRGSNLLFMNGLRANKLTDFNQMVQFHVTINETTPLSAKKQLKKTFGSQNLGHRSSKITVVEEHVLSVPTEGTMPLGAPRPTITFGLRRTLPPKVLIEGVLGVKKIHEAVASAGMGKAVDGPTADGHLNFETMRTSLGEMLSEQGARFTAVSIPGAVLNPGPGGLRVKARFSDVLQLYYMEKAEKEKYDHGTDLVADTDVSTRKEHGAFTVAATGPVAPGQSLGAQVSGGFQRSRASGIDHTAWIEHRAWLREDSSVFFVFALLEYEVTVPGTSTRTKVPGSVEMVVTKQEAIDWGIPVDALWFAVPAGKRNKEFPGYHGAGESTSAAPPTGTVSDDRRLAAAFRKAVEALNTTTTTATALPTNTGVAGPSDSAATTAGPAGDLGATGQATDPRAGDSNLSNPEPEWLRTSLGRIKRPDEQLPNLLSDMSVPGVRTQPPPVDLRATARQQPNQYFVWLSTAPGAAVDRQVFEWLNERLEQLAQAGRTPIVVTRGQLDLDDVPGKSKSVPGSEKRSLIPLLSRYGVAVIHQVPRSSGGLGGLNLSNSWKVRGSSSAAASGRKVDDTWSKIDLAVVNAARRLTRSTVRPVSEALGELVWGAQGVDGQLAVLRSRWEDLRATKHLVEQASRMAERVPDSMNIALVKPLLRFGPNENVVVQFTKSTPEQRPSTMLEAVARLELDAAGKLKDPQDSGGVTDDLVDLVQAVRLGADKAEHSPFDFTVSLLKAIGQVKAGRFDDAERFVAENQGRLNDEQKKAWVNALSDLQRSMDHTERGRLQPVLAAVLAC
ncbi:hypothetical protein HNR22_001723 [Micromonospora jinlongensis]|uniref:Uncharacterized protein n=1 Tax=Micromonospora jinlongensis TaxID=1287877 RepID=A0A7Z0BCL8_9ACTN|nr:hypothetical protein [Micromonospora jinlongensis]NYH41996.1 hypothetical protein [Micromonospora jinlongensis]